MTTRNGRVRRILVGAIMGLLMITEVMAQQAPQGERLIEAVESCRSDAEESRRLACYDEAADELIAARRAQNLAVLTRSDVEAGKPVVFGREVVTPTSRSSKLPVIDTLDSTVTHIGLAGRDLFTVTLQDGSVWRTIEPGRKRPAVGDDVHVRRAALGSYLASFDKARSVRILRIR